MKKVREWKEVKNEAQGLLNEEQKLILRYLWSDLHENVVPKHVYPLHHDAFCCPLLVSFHLQITYRKVKNPQVGVNKLVG